MADLSSWLLVIRIFQLMAALAAGSLNGRLVVTIYVEKLGLSMVMVVLELLICIMLVYTTLAIFIQHTGKRSRSTFWLSFFTVFDVIFCGVDVSIISMLSFAGLPSNCGGLTRSDYTGDDSREQPSAGYSTIRFSDEAQNHKGELDKYCSLERSFFFIAVGILFLFITTIVLTVLRACLKKYEKGYVENGKADHQLLEALDRVEDGDKMFGMSPLSSAPKLLPAAPPSEGIITRNTSVRSTMTASTNNPYRNSNPPSHRLSAAPPVPQRMLVPQLSIPNGRPGSVTGLGYAGPSHHLEEDDEAAAAVVADGMRHRSQQEHQVRMPMLMEEEQTADSALVSDGMRPNEPMLPPYEPGSSRMAGHGLESNELRLSEYVKGQTRAQAMKDSGRY